MRPICLIPGLLALSLFSGITSAQDNAPDGDRKARSEPAAKATTKEQLRLILQDAASAVRTLEKKGDKKNDLLDLADFEWRMLEEPKAEAFLAIGSAQARIGDMESARKTWQEALDVASEVQSFNRTDKAALIARIAEAQAEAGEHDDALDSLRQASQAARLMKDAEGRAGRLRLPALVEGDPSANRAAMLVAIAEVQAKAGDQRSAGKSFDQANDAASGIKNPVIKFRTFVEIACAQDPTGSRDVWDRTLSAPMAATDEFQKAKGVEFVLRALTQMGKEEQALQLASDRLKGDLKGLSLAVIANELMSREKPASLHFVQSLREAASKQEFDRPFKRSKVFSMVAILLARAGDSDGAYKVIDSLNPDNVVLRSHHLREKIDVMREIAQVHLKAGRKNDAKDTLQTALESIAPFQGNNGELSFPLKGILELLAKVGNTDDAIGIAGNIQSSHARADSLLGIALVQVEVGARDAALKTIDQALQSIDGIPNDLLWMGLDSESRQIVRRLKATSSSLDFTFQMGPKYNVLKTAAIAFGKAGDLTRAVETAKRIPASDDFAGSHESVEALTKIATIQAKNGDFDGALKTADLIHENDSLFKTEKAELLSEIAKEQARKGEARSALERASKYSSPKTRLLVWQRMAEGIAEKDTREKPAKPTEKP